MNKKNLIIGILMVLIFIMATGYMAFATKLTISGNTNISSVWSVGFLNTNTTNYEITTGTITYNDGSNSKGTKPEASIQYLNNIVIDNDLSTTVNITAKVYQPGDIIKFILPVKNTGTLTAKLSNPILTVNGNVLENDNEYISPNGGMSISVSNFDTDNLSPQNTTNLVVTIKYNNSVVSETTSEDITCSITFIASQA